MCFKDANKNFIIQKIYATLNRHDESKRAKEYLGIKDEVILRIQKSYKNCDNRKQFYLDVFNVFSVYESEYLMLNLFLDTECDEIVKYLLENDFAKLTFKFDLNNSIGYNFYNFIISKNDFKKSDINSFLKSQLVEELNVFNDVDWKNETEGNNPLMTVFASFLTENNQDEFSEKTLGFHLFVKMWNHYPEFVSPLISNIKAITFYNALNNNINGDEGFYQLYEELVSIYEELFVKPSYIPILDNNKDEYKQGYLNQRNKFLQNVSLLASLSDLNVKLSFSDLLEQLIENKNQQIIEKCNLVISDKLKSLTYPEDQVVLDYIGLRGEKPNIDDFMKKLYIY